MSIIDLFKMICEGVASFFTWKGSGILLLAVMSIPIVLFLFYTALNICARYWYDDEEKK